MWQCAKMVADEGVVRVTQSCIWEEEGIPLECGSGMFSIRSGSGSLCVPEGSGGLNVEISETGIVGSDKKVVTKFA
jgi:hypothetical protein